MSSSQYGRVHGGNIKKDDEDGLVDEWGVRYEGHTKPGGGRFHSKKRHSRRKFFLLGAGAVILLMIIVIIVVAVQKHTVLHHEQYTTIFENRTDKQEGLVFYPAPSDGTVFITYQDMAKAADGGYGILINSMDKALFDYQSVNQQDDAYVDCNSTYAPADRICRFDTSVFRGCTSFTEYGYSSGRPCILLQLKLARNKTAESFPNNTHVHTMLKERYSPDHIGVTCYPASSKDRTGLSPDKMFNPAIQYFPPKGFPISWYRPRTIDRFLAPVVMVKFNNIIDFTTVRINCTAWGRNFNNGNPQDSTIYSTSFVIKQE